jgi:hypothetical protein
VTSPTTGFGAQNGAQSSSTLPAFNWATKPSPADYSERLIRITDVGVNGSTWYSDGTQWVHESPIIYQQAAKGWLVPSLAAANAATYSQTGTTITVTSVGHNIPATAHDGKDVYLAIASGDAAAGWYSNFTRTGVDTFTRESSVSQSASGIVNTNTAETIVTPVTKTVLGGLMGANGSLMGSAHVAQPTSANFKRVRWKFDGSTVLEAASSTTSFDNNLAKSIRNRNSESKQVFRNAATGDFLGNVAVGTGYSTVNTASDVQSSVTLQVPVANEFIALEAFMLEIKPS